MWVCIFEWEQLLYRPLPMQYVCLLFPPCLLLSSALLFKTLVLILPEALSRRVFLMLSMLQKRMKKSVSVVPLELAAEVQHYPFTMQEMQAPGNKWSFSLFIPIFPLVHLTPVGCLSCLCELESLWVRTVTVSVSVSASNVCYDLPILSCCPPAHVQMVFLHKMLIELWAGSRQDFLENRKTNPTDTAL